MNAGEGAEHNLSSIVRSCAPRRGSQPALVRRTRVAATWLFSALLAAPAFGAQTEITISMAPAPATPRLLGAALIGSLPNSPFLYTISATGKAPLTFAATGLPSGLSISATTGTISGTTPAAGSYPIQITVSNASGSATNTLTLSSGSTLALTPPMGWNSYDSFGANVTEKDVLAAAQAMKTLLQPYGWNTVVVDYLWYDPEQTTDANGRWLPSKSKFPSATGSDGFKALAAQVHALGLSFGIHLMRGIPRKAVTSNTPILNSTATASQAGNTSDTCSWDAHMYGVRADTAAGKAWYDSIYAQYADWGVDFVKVDDMMNPYGGNVLHSAEVEAVHASIAKTGRSMMLSLSPGPNQPKDVAILNTNATMWRQVNDFWDTNGLSSIADEFTAANSWANTTGITPGHWPDADMLPLGTIGSRACAFSHNEQVTVMSLWAIMPSPLIFGGMPSKLSTDAWSLALLTNEEVLAINQDVLGARAKRITQQGSTEVWAKDLAGGGKAVALFNRGTQDATVSVTFSQLNVTGAPTVRDLWQRADVAGVTTGLSVNVPNSGALLYALRPPGNPGAGGAGGSGNVAEGGHAGAEPSVGGSAGASAAAGAPSVGSGGAASTSAGSVGRGGDGAGGSAPVGNGGASADSRAGAPAGTPRGGANSGAVANGTEKSGCSCSLGPRPGAPAWLLLAWAAIASGARLRRRVRTAR
jgi:alpha-galactosidase